MLISMNWISEFVDLNEIDIYNLINRFTLSTAEVEEIREYGEDIQNVVAGKIIAILPHSTSHKLHILSVDVGNEIIQCICGASNVREGIMVPFAKAGGSIHGLRIEKTVIAGIESCGMCCSEKELGISDDHSGLMILEDTVEPGTDIKAIIQIDDIVFEVDNKSLTNRPDLWGHYGIAREMAALAGRTLKAIPILDTDEYNALPPVSIEIIDREKTLRYSSMVIKNITRPLSPVTMRIRLYYCGIRSINLLADLTNYLMLELGQPMHAFDYALVDKITVRTFDKEILFKTLDGNQRKIDTDALMICNGETPVAIAGIMGGENSEISDKTTSVLLESANFDGVAVRKTSTRFGLRTEASARYEKVIDPELTTLAIKRFVKLLTQADPDVIISSKLTDVYVKRYPEIRILFTKDYVDRYTGIDISNQQIISTLTALGFKVSNENNQFMVIVPSYRATKDITIKADIIEEITRIYGYDNFVLQTNKSLLIPVRHSIERDNEYNAKQILADRFSLHEVHSYIWYNTKQNRELGIKTDENVKIINSVSPDSNMIRESMIPTLLNIIYENKATFSEMGIFEIGRVVKGLNQNGECDEHKYLGFAITSKQKSDKEMFFKAKQILNSIGLMLKNIQFDYRQGTSIQNMNWIHPFNSAEVSYDGINLGYFSVLHPVIAEKIDRKLTIAIAEIDFGSFTAISKTPVLYKEFSKYPGIDIDLSLLVNKEVPYSQLTGYIDEFTCEYLQKYKLVDIYEDEAVLQNQKSVTIHFSFAANDHTLTSDEVSKFIDNLIKLLNSKEIKLR